MNNKPFVDFLLKRNKCLYHFTDTRNIETIKEAGLLSLKEIKHREIAVKAFGGNKLSHELDAGLGYDGFVHLALTNSHPMEKAAKQSNRIIVSRYLRISPEILLKPSVLFSDAVSNSKLANIGDWDQVGSKFDLEALYRRLDWGKPDGQKRRQKVEKYEILVPDIVEPRFIDFRW